MASGAADILARARIVATLGEALDGIHHACATAMTPRDFGPPTCAPREHFAGAARPSGQRVAFVFGSERFGLSQRRCLPLPRLPEHPHRSALRLAQPGAGGAADRLRLAPGAAAASPSRRAPTPATRADAAAVQGLLAHWQRALIAIGFLDPAAPKKLMPRLHQLLNRAQLDAEEVHILRGIARAMRRAQARGERCLRAGTADARPIHWLARTPRTRPCSAPARRHRLHPGARPRGALDAGRC